MAILYLIGIDRSKLHGCFKRGCEVKAFLSNKIIAMVLRGCRDGLIATRIGHG